jgi:hypothetical protein
MILALAFFTSWAGVVSSVAALAAAVSAGAAVVMARRNRNAVIKAVVEVHTIVNSAMTALKERNEQLVKALQASGVKIPSSPKDPE